MPNHIGEEYHSIELVSDSSVFGTQSAIRMMEVTEYGQGGPRAFSSNVGNVTTECRHEGGTSMAQEVRANTSQVQASLSS